MQCGLCASVVEVALKLHKSSRSQIHAMLALSRLASKHRPDPRCATKHLQTSPVAVLGLPLITLLGPSP